MSNTQHVVGIKEAESEFSEYVVYVKQMRYKKTIFHEIKIVIMYNAFIS